MQNETIPKNFDGMRLEEIHHWCRQIENKYHEEKNDQFSDLQKVRRITEVNNGQQRPKAG